MAQQAGFPMISEKHWWTIRNRFKASIPTTVTPTYAKSLLSLSSESSATSNVLTPLKRLGLIDEEGKPTDLANTWRLDQTYAESCETILNSVYPKELLELCPTNKVDRGAAITWFMSQGVGVAAARKMAGLFILLRSGEIKTAAKSSSATTKPSGKASGSEHSAGKKKALPQENAKGTNLANNVNAAAHPDIHIDLQIHISPDSSTEQIDAIFSSMSKYLYGRAIH